MKYDLLNLLDEHSDKLAEVPQEELDRKSGIILETLKYCKVKVNGVTSHPGPRVSSYSLSLEPGARVSSVRRRELELRESLRASIRINCDGESLDIEVPNDKSSPVPLKSLLSDESVRKVVSEYALPIVLGLTVKGVAKTFDLTDSPHLLLAGATKQGKTCCINEMMASLLLAKEPDDLKFVLIDPRMCELSVYSGIADSYLARLWPESGSLNPGIIHSIEQTEETLDALCREMELRYELFAKTGVDGIRSYNGTVRSGQLPSDEEHRHLPYIVCVIDELADLLFERVRSRKIENSIIRLAQRGRAAGIHLIVATQRPSRNVISGLLKSNFPTRIAFRTSSNIDSRVIIDADGAEKLTGSGDCLYSCGSELVRVQSALIENAETARIVECLGSSEASPYCLPAPEICPPVRIGASDALLADAAELVVIRRQCSISLLQRELAIGFARAGRIVSQLETAGIVGPENGSRPREVLVKDIAELRRIIS